MSSKLIGTVARGLCAPAFQPGDDLADIVARTVLAAASQEGIILHSSDTIGVAAPMVARSLKNYVTVDQLAALVREKYGENATLGVLWPTYSTSTFAALLKGLARGARKLVLQLAYPSDESGRRVMSLDALYDAGVDPFEDTLSEESYLSLFSEAEEQSINFGTEYMDFCRAIAESESCEIEFFFSNHPSQLLKRTRNVLYCHRNRSFRLEKKLQERGVRTLLGLNELFTEPFEGSGHHPRLGLLGAVTDSFDQILLAPYNTDDFEEELRRKLKKATGLELKTLVFPQKGQEDFSDRDAAPLCSMVADSMSASCPLVLLQGYRPQ